MAIYLSALMIFIILFQSSMAFSPQLEPYRPAKLRGQGNRSLWPLISGF